MREFEYACRAWFACMPIPEDRNTALQRAIEIANEVPFEPNRPPKPVLPELLPSDSFICTGGKRVYVGRICPHCGAKESGSECKLQG